MVATAQADGTAVVIRLRETELPTREIRWECISLTRIDGRDTGIDTVSIRIPVIAIEHRSHRQQLRKMIDSRIVDLLVRAFDADEPVRLTPKEATLCHNIVYQLQTHELISAGT